MQDISREKRNLRTAFTEKEVKKIASRLLDKLEASKEFNKTAPVQFSKVWLPLATSIEQVTGNSGITASWPDSKDRWAKVKEWIE